MIEVISAGMLTTIQDQGRYGFRSMGVPVSGAMDAYSAGLANLLLGNLVTAALLECTLLGPTLLFSESATIAITGAHFQPTIDGMPVQLHKRVSIEKGTTLKLGSATKGMYGYLSIHGGFSSEMILGSTSFYNGITKKSRFEKGDRLNFKTNNVPSEKLESNVNHLNFDTNTIEVYEGPEFEKLSKSEQEILLKTEYKIAPQSNRMATVFEVGRGVASNEILTAPVQPGTVQITPSGKLIILMRDAQTTGGYGRIFQLTEMSINLLSQQRPGNTIIFKLLR